MPLLGATPYASGQGGQSVPLAHAFDIICFAYEAICHDVQAMSQLAV